VLIELGRLDRARAMLESEEYRGDDSVLWGFAAALVAFKQGRTGDASRPRHGHPDERRKLCQRGGHAGAGEL